MKYAIRELHPTADVLEQARVMERYMPSNYSAFPAMTVSGTQVTLGVLIVGEDVAGWGLDTYVLPRLASGLYYAHEISAAEALNAWTRIGAV